MKGPLGLKVIKLLKTRFLQLLAPIFIIGVLNSPSAAGQNPNPSNDVPAVVEDNDPLEGFNRAMFEFNLALDRAILRPLTYLYRQIPDPIQTGVHNFLENLRSPVIFFNDVLQGDTRRAGTTLARFGLNSTIGILGLNDFATDLGLEKHDEDFGQTLAVWEFESGPYLMLPFFGPSNPRDTVGLVTDTLLDPFSWLTSTEFRIARTVVTAVDKRSQSFEQINDLQKNSLDFYSAVRSLYQQKRRAEIRNGAPTANKPAPSGLSGLGFRNSGQLEDADTAQK